MVLKIRDAETRKVIKMFSKYISLIWTSRFQEFGDFELVVPLTTENMNLFKKDRYLQNTQSKSVMVIEEITADIDEFDPSLTVKGHSVETFLNRRVIYEWRDVTKVILPGVFSKEIFDNSFKKSTSLERNVNFIDFDVSRVVEPSVGFEIDVNRGDIISDAIYTLCTQINGGIKSTFNEEDLSITYYMCSPVDKTKNVKFVNAKMNSAFTNSTYYESITDFKTTALVAGSGEDTKRQMITVSRSTTILDKDNNSVQNIIYKGINRREIFVDARDLQKASGESAAKYKERLRDRGKTKLLENNKIYAIDGKVNDVGKYLLGRDYDLGDVVTIQNKYIKAFVLITEIIQSWNNEGYSIYPSFIVLNTEIPELDESFNIE